MAMVHGSGARGSDLPSAVRAHGAQREQAQEAWSARHGRRRVCMHECNELIAFFGFVFNTRTPP